jgi:hypothetical protein
MNITQKQVDAVIRGQKAASFQFSNGAYGTAVPFGCGLDGIEVQWLKVQTKMGYVRHDFRLRGPVLADGTRRTSPSNESGLARTLVRDALSGIARDRFDVAYLLGEGRDLNEAARIVNARCTARRLDENCAVTS